MGTPCCKPCGRDGQCAIKRSCCLECHFGYEELHCGPHLPEHIRERIRQEHQDLIAQGLPAEAVHEHAHREMEWFREFGVPEDLLAQLEADHHEYEDGQMRSRQRVVSEQKRRNRDWGGTGRGF